MQHEIPGVFHKLLRHGRGFGLSDLEETAKVAGHRPYKKSWFRPEKVQATSSFACQLQSTYKDLSRVDLDLSEGLLVGLGYAATSPDSPFDFRQAQTAAERSEVAGPHCWSLMLPTSARVAQEVYEPLIGIQSMLCSRMGDTWQIGTTSIREDQRIATGLRFVHWCHTSPNLQARRNPNNDPTVRVYQHLEDQALTRKTSWPLQPLGKGPRTYAIVSPLPIRRRMQRLQSRWQAPRPTLHRDSRCVNFFFPRVRTPCGHGAQVIVEGREEQSDGGEKNKDPQTKPTPTNTPSPQAESPPSSSLSSTLGETCETETNGN